MYNLSSTKDFQPLFHLADFHTLDISSVMIFETASSAISTTSTINNTSIPLPKQQQQYGKKASFNSISMDCCDDSSVVDNNNVTDVFDNNTFLTDLLIITGGFY